MMTLQEVASQLGMSENSLYKNFKRTQKSLLKRGVILTRITKNGYTLEYEEIDEMDLEAWERQSKIEYYKKQIQKLEEQGE